MKCHEIGLVRYNPALYEHLEIVETKRVTNTVKPSLRTMC